MSNFKKACNFIIEAHDGQIRKMVNTPYVFHLFEVSQIVSTMSNDEDTWCAALLHDCVEDRGISIDDIKKEFNERIAYLVSMETEDKKGQVNKAATWKLRKIESLEELKNCNDIEVKKIWLADKLSNIRSLYHCYLEDGDNIWNAFNEKDPKNHGWYYSEIGRLLKELKDYTAYKEYIEIIKKLFGGYDEI